jgi:peptidoglycan hydrolase CwlO-like protein
MTDEEKEIKELQSVIDDRDIEIEEFKTRIKELEKAISDAIKTLERA